MATSAITRRPRATSGEPGALARVLAANLQKIIDHERATPSGWAASHKADKKQVQRAYNAATSATLDTVETIAKAAGLHPWQLLFPSLDPANPPMFCLTMAERMLYSKIRSAFDQLPPINPP